MRHLMNNRNILAESAWAIAIIQLEMRVRSLKA